MNSLVQCIFLGLFLFLKHVASNPIELDNNNCGEILIYNDTKESIPLPLSEISGSNLDTFISTYKNWKITSIIVEPGRLFHLCAVNRCKTFDEKDKTVDKDLQDIDNGTISAKCYSKKQNIPKNRSCAELSSELLKTDECVRFYRNKTCNEILPHEIGKENETRSFHEVFESLAVRKGCGVVVKTSKGIQNVTSQDDLLPLYGQFLNPHPRGIDFTCIC